MTRMPIVYSPRRTGSVSPYEAKIYLSTPRECRGTITQHLKNIGASFRDRIQVPEADNKEQRSMSKDVLKDFFRDQPEFASDESIASFLGVANIDEVIGPD